MAINRVSIPTPTAPVTIADYQALLDQMEARNQAFTGAYLIDDAATMIRSGRVVLIGGILYKSTSNTTITGTPSKYVKVTPAGATATATYVANLTGVAWNNEYGGYYDGSGNIYIFDEAQAIFDEVFAIGYTLVGRMATGTYTTNLLARGNGVNSTKIGFGAIAGAPNSIGVGVETIANAANSIGVGSDARAYGVDAIAIGIETRATGAGSIAIGALANANRPSSVAIGPNISTGISSNENINVCYFGGGVGFNPIGRLISFLPQATSDDVFDELSPYVPNVNNRLQILLSGNYTSGTQTSFILRSGANTVEVYYPSGLNNIYADGSSTQIGIYLTILLIA